MKGKGGVELVDVGCIREEAEEVQTASEEPMAKAPASEEDVACPGSRCVY